MPGPMKGGPMGNRLGKKEKLDFKALMKVYAFCKPYSFGIVVSILCAIVGAITTIIGPDKIAHLMDIITGGIFTGIDMGAFVETGTFLICLYVVGSVFAYAQQYIMAIITQKASKRLRTEIDKKINRLPLSFFDSTTRGDVLSRVTNDVDVISQTLGSALANLISSVVLFFGLIIKMFLSNWLLAIVTIVSSFLGFGFMALILSKSQKYFNKKQEYVGEINGQVEEVYTNYKIVKSYGAVQKEKNSFDQKNDRICTVDWKSQFLSGMMMPIMVFVGNLSYVLIFVVGVSIILGGGSAVTIGTLISFVIYAKLFSQPLSTFAQSMTSFQQSSAASKRVFEILEAKEMEDETINIT